MRESEAIALFVERVPRMRAIRGPGDDAAVLAAPGGNLVWATDLLIEGRHFLPEISSLRDAAAKSLARNVSDLAAMGAEPLGFLAAVALPESDEATVGQIADGFADAANEFGIGLAGGDLSRDDHVVFAVTVLGSVDGDGLGRDGAQPGDLLAVTGSLGAASAGLALHRRAHGPGDAEARHLLARHPGLSERHRRGMARLAEGRAIRGRAHAAIDVSDGLAIDCARIAAASGVQLCVDPARLPIASGVAEAAAFLGQDPLGFALTGGDDYELVAAIPEEALDEVEPGWTVIGRVVAGAPGVVDPCGVPLRGGHDHFS